MKLIITSDIHGSALSTELLMQHVDKEQPDFIVLLGDLLYHGPRNPLPEGHDPMRVAELLNAKHEQIIAVRGNCDAEVDQMVLNFPCMGDFAELDDAGRTLFFTHGHVFSPDKHPELNAGSFFFSGHTHVKTNEERNGVTYVNPGSTSLPKDGSKSFAIYEDGHVTLKALETGEEITL
ncbi:MAG: phosphodiesterase [Eggerthellaceae bacterium]|nr:phosphodiesterase [Eggerthellaceae bacterium]